MRRALSLLLGLCAAMLLGAASAQDDLPILDLDQPLRMDFSGYWEKDFQRSDNWEQELGRQMSMRQQSAANQAAGISSRRGPSVSLGNMNLNRGRRGANIVDLARVAEYVTRQNTLQIFQDRNAVTIERDGEAPLLCSIEPGIHETFESAHGSEICGWDNQHLVFEILLPDDLLITHRYTVTSDGQRLRVLTSVQHRNSAPFNLVHAFNRFEAPTDDFNCITTLTRGNMCSQVTPLDELNPLE